VAYEVHYESSGRPDAPAVILAPSLGTVLSMWEPQARELEQQFRVVRYDLRGHGSSPVPPGPYSLAELGADLLALLDRLGLEQASLCGISIGGMACMWVAAHAPKRVQRLVVCCSSGLIDPEGNYRQRARTVRERGMDPVAETVLARWFTAGFSGSHPEVVERMRRGLVGTAPEGYAGCCEALAEMDLRPELPTIEAPTLVLAGREDAATPPEHGRRIAEGIPDARFELVEDAAHLANVEQPEAVGELIGQHLNARPANQRLDRGGAI
jgi:3-oxoadipate enol-lactonase